MIMISKVIDIFLHLQILWIKQKQCSRNTNSWVSLVKICDYVRKRTIHYHINNKGNNLQRTVTSFNRPLRTNLTIKLKTFKTKIYYLLMRATFIYCCLSFPLQLGACFSRLLGLLSSSVGMIKDGATLWLTPGINILRLILFLKNVP